MEEHAVDKDELLPPALREEYVDPEHQQAFAVNNFCVNCPLCLGTPEGEKEGKSKTDYIQYPYVDQTGELVYPLELLLQLNEVPWRRLVLAFASELKLTDSNNHNKKKRLSHLERLRVHEFVLGRDGKGPGAGFLGLFFDMVAADLGYPAWSNECETTTAE
jgi:hypothetical protein